ncbi:MAG: hypothetical protein PHH49_06055 [Candidatus Omnitrophica bacterium]|nr:hypothetical protein [Candidatus Omnitrophota bacterium]MDD5488505.1 hypothetical protein [Candidatus Omnitrophota bacterium]
MDGSRIKALVTLGAVIVGCVLVGLWLIFPLSSSGGGGGSVTSKEMFLMKVETELDNMRMLLALRTNMGFIEAQDPAERIRDLCSNMNREGYEKWSAIVDDMNAWYTRLVIEGNASVDEVLGELYAKYPFLELEGVEVQK